ncbi:MAG: tetratricopeptide repeat protein, partial [Prosthecobacter sp.]|nr:tetratricopeptide repeat protein [Prosthecobacter sp.]
MPPASNAKAGLILIGGLAGLIALIAWALWPQPNYTPVPITEAPARPIQPYVMPDEKAVFAQYAGSASCRSCHEAEFTKWQGSHHGLAERLPTDALDLAAFQPPQIFTHGTQKTEARQGKDGFEIVSLGFDGKNQPYPVQRVIGHDPLRQFLVHGPRGALHAMEACFDPHKGDWFNVYGNEDRKPGEWGHWTGRGMVWNQMCASCHNTRVRKNYNPSTDTYHTTMAEMTVSCESCHGPMKAHSDWQMQYKGSGQKDPTLTKWSRDQHLENCAGCHARRGEITGDFVPGESFWDHYQLTITDGTDIYYPDGQIRDENYEFSSFLSSRMYHAGVRCMDCHDMHSMKTILPGNQLCLRCHTPGGFPNAPPIQPEAHSFHSTASTGNQCIHCHMPQTTYMQRHPRHDHGFTIPDPLLTKQFGIPNACNKCHTDKDTEWSITATEKWWGEKMNRKTRSRATLIAQARQGNPTARDGLLALLESDEIPHWKASASLLLDRWAAEPAVITALQNQLQHEHPLVRQSAARSLEPALAAPGVRPALEKLLTDPARSVRVTAAWALRENLNLDSPAAKDLQHMLQHNADQPSGQMQLGQWHYAQRDLPAAIQHMETAIRWDPNSPPFHHDLALLHSTAGNTPQTIQKLRDAIQLAPNEAQYHYELGLALSETGDLAATAAALRECVRLQPRFARAWYNLGLALSQQGQTAEAIAALKQAETADPRDPTIPYARATIHAQLGQKAEAIAAAEQAIR